MPSGNRYWLEYDSERSGRRGRVLDDRVSKATLKGRITPQQVKEALRNTSGNLTRAAHKLGVNRRSLYRYIDRNPEMQHVLDDIIESRLDRSEDTLTEAIGAGNVSAAIFYLKTKGKHRGYVERQQTTGADGGPVSIAVAPQDAKL